MHTKADPSTSAVNRPFPSSSSSSTAPQAIPTRHISTDPLTNTLAEKLNELALANADGLLDDEAHRLLRQNLFERYSQAEAQTQSISSRTWNETSTTPAGKRISSGFGFSNGNEGSSTGKKRTSWMNPSIASTPLPSTQSSNKTLSRAPSIESQRSIATAVSSLFRRATRRSGSSYSRGQTSPDRFMQDQEHDLEHHEASSIYSRPSFSSNNFPYSGAYGSMVRGMGMSRQLSSDSLVSVGTGVGSVTGSVAGSVSVTGFPSHLQIHTSHSTLGLSSGFPPSPSSASVPVDIRTLSVSRRMLGTYASSISSRTTARSNKPPSSFHLRHATTNSNSIPNSHSQSQPFSLSALVKARSHEGDAEDDEYTYGYDDLEDRNKEPPSSGPKIPKSAAALRAEIEAMEAEGRRVLDAFNALELSVLTKGGRMHVGGSSLISSVPEEMSVPVDAVSIKSVKSSSSKDKERERDKGRGGSSGSSSGMSGSIRTTTASSSLTSTSATATTIHTMSTSATSVSASTSGSVLSPPPQPALHTSHSSPNLLRSASTSSKSKPGVNAHVNGQGTTPTHPVPAIPITPSPKKRPSILLQRRKTGKTVVLPPSIVAASLEIKEREKEKERTSAPSISVITMSAHTSTVVPTATSASTDGPPSTRVRTRSHSRERPAREKPPSIAPPPLPPPPPSIPTLPPSISTKHPYADPSLALSLTIPDSNPQSQHQPQTPQSLTSPTSLPSLGALSSLTDELSTIRQRRATVAKRYDRRLEFLRAKLKSAEIREMLR
ncbi:hypothetical protein Clacol_009960 [Clathrus columnatus]|uniref:Uncharacterized protein n=1 Tax=Clathrus columnatus TaxID=1419009 RepID=A0AAV5APF9_9AGAM|nr:hypothetical protein Clacol_009960 [Clathrus columnatus]